MYKVLLHNDDKNSFEHVIQTLVVVFYWTNEKSVEIAKEAHEKGVALCEIYPFERAEHVRDILISYSLVATIEPE
jgi:ATP-dependent Clp protease adaptor protein ClpS